MLEVCRHAHYGIAVGHAHQILIRGMLTTLWLKWTDSWMALYLLPGRRRRRRAGGLVCRSEMRLQFIRKSSAGRPYGPILHSAVVCHLGPNLHGNLLFLFLARLL